LEHDEQAQFLGMNARKMIEEHYNWEVWAKRLIEIIAECVKI
jgi:glycosyltransferase involved in cell wall biosynthesis